MAAPGAEPGGAGALAALPNITIWKTGVEVLAFMTYKRLQHFVRSCVADPHPARRATQAVFEVLSR